MCSHRELPYAGAKRINLRPSELAQDHSILLPIYAQMTDDEQEYVASALKRELQRPRGRAAKAQSKLNPNLSTTGTGH
jgi:perosamine synthetase